MQRTGTSLSAKMPMSAKVLFGRRICQRFSGDLEGGYGSERSDKRPITSFGAEALPQLPTRSDRAPSRKPGVGKRLILITAGIICVGTIGRIRYHLLGEGTPTTNKAVVEGYTYPVSSRIDGSIAGILVSNRQYVKAGDLLAEIDKRDLEAKLAAALTVWAQTKTMLPEIETHLSKAQAELETAESRIFHCDRQLTEAISDYQSPAQPHYRAALLWRLDH